MRSLNSSKMVKTVNSKENMATVKATALVLRTTDWSESSRICTLWTREFGKVRALAKGGRRLKSAFESALDLLTVCSIVLLRKTSGGLDLLTEAQVVQRFSRLASDLPALYSGYYIAELLADWTEENDPHPNLFEEALATLSVLGQTEFPTGPRLARFEMVLLRELGYSPTLGNCAVCAAPVDGQHLGFSPAAGGVVCAACQSKARDRRPLTTAAWNALGQLAQPGDAWRRLTDGQVRAEVRQVLNHYVTYLMGRRPRLLPYLGS
jgi:DNA repair protein RecO (recombination protein O)